MALGACTQASSLPKCNRMIFLSTTVKERKLWVMKGWIRQDLESVFENKELFIILFRCRLVMLIIIQAHGEDHCGEKQTKARSQSFVWMQCMEDLPAERYSSGFWLFTWICLDYIGPAIVRVMTNEQSQIKVYPLIFVCQGIEQSVQ